MLIILLAYLGGVLTIVSPCILPVLPFVFARADRSFARSTLPLLAGMAVTFAARRDARSGRRRLGGARQRSRPLGRADPARFVRDRPCLPATSPTASRARLSRSAHAFRSAPRPAPARKASGPRLSLGSRPDCCGRRAPDRSSASFSPPPRSRARASAPPSCCSLMRSAPRPRSRLHCSSAARCSRG